VKGNFALLARAAASPLPLPVKDLDNRRSLLGIDNFISALAFVLATPATLGETYVVADPVASRHRPRSPRSWDRSGARATATLPEGHPADQRS
jgi:nucleoside-diphosphate-sugar epimerase